MSKTTNADLIRLEIQNRFKRASSSGFSSVDILAGDLHEKMEFNDGTHPNQMPSICNMMYEAQVAGDEILYSPPKGRGARLLIRYQIPRR